MHFAGDRPAASYAQPRVSIVVPAFNASRFVEAAIGSVRAQTATEWEAIIVDDGSTDDTAAVVRRAAGADPRIRLICQPNSGTAVARNAGAAAARSEWLLFLDADDLLLPEYLERQTAFAGTHPGFDIYSSNALLEMPDGTTCEFWSGPRSRHVHCLEVEDQIRESSILIMSLVRRSVFDRLGGFRSLHSEDYDFWLRALLGGARHIYNPIALAVYRRHEGQRTRELVEEARSFLWILEDAAKQPELKPAQVALLSASIRFAHARILRRELEEALLGGRYRGARTSYWRSRHAFPAKGKFLLGLAIIWISPRIYASLKSRRMI
jgi:glycosyltransferase involved in cell wall biosynthesis